MTAGEPAAPPPVEHGKRRWPFRRRTRPAPQEAPGAPDTETGSGGLGRGNRILIGLAAGAVISFGMAAIAGILAPTLLALVLTICAQPVRVWLERHGAPQGLATGAVGLTVFALLAGFIGLLWVATAQFVGMLPQYKSQLEQLGGQIGAWLQSIGVGPQQVTDIENGFKPTNFLSFFTGLLGNAFGLVAFLVIVLTMLILMPSDAAYTPSLLRQLEPTRPNFVYAFVAFGHSVRRYMVVTTLLGVVQGVLNGVALVLLGVPAALLWAILSFLCSFIPNVGYFFALVPPLVFGYLTGGWGTVLAIVVVYGLINAVVQSVVQPKVVGNAVALSQTLTFFSVLYWAVVLGAIGAILAIPLTLLARAVLVDSDPRSRMWRPLLGDLKHTRELMRTEAQAARRSAVRRMVQGPRRAAALPRAGRPAARRRAPRPPGRSRPPVSGVGRCARAAAPP